MAWDDTKANGPPALQASEWNAMVTDQKTRLVGSLGSATPNSFIIVNSGGTGATPSKFIISATATDVKMNGAQSLGTIDELPRIDHVHPVDTSRMAAGATPVYHASSHYTGGADVISPSSIGAMAVGATPVSHSSSHQFGEADSLGTMLRTIFLSLAGGWASTTYGDSGFTTTQCSTTSGATPTTFNMKGTLFDAAAYDRNHEFGHPMPLNWDGGTVSAKPYVMVNSNPTTGDTLILGIRCAVIKTGEAPTPLTFGVGASTFFSLAISDMNKLLIGNSATPSVGVTAITPSCSGSAAGGDWMQWKCSRAGYDTYSGGATVLGWLITYGTNNYSDE